MGSLVKHLFLLTLPLLSVAFDAVLWSNEQNKRFDQFSLQSGFSQATVDRPLVLILVNQFELADFSRFAKVYEEPGKETSALTKWLRSSDSYSVDWLSSKITVPSTALEYNSDIDPALLDSATIIVVRADELEKADSALPKIQSSVSGRKYVAVLTDSALVRKLSKRQAGDEPPPIDDQTDTEPVDPQPVDKEPVNNPEPVDVPEPVKNPEPQIEADTDEYSDTRTDEAIFSNSSECLIYLAKPALRVKDPAVDPYKPDASGSPAWADISLNSSVWKLDILCMIMDRTYTEMQVNIKPTDHSFAKDWVTELDFTLHFNQTGDNNKTSFWELTGVSVSTLTVNTKLVNPTTTDEHVITPTMGAYAKSDKLYLYSVPGYCWVCERTEPIYITTPKAKKPKKGDTQFGIILGEFQVQPFGNSEPHRTGSPEHLDKMFNKESVDDCAAIFSAPVWMGLIVGFVMLIIFLFGISMISSLQTMDRFDDPKAKPLQINVRGE